ncbi:hypothetical protein AMECASPLE_034481, partial [Ameca splendens]
NSTLLCKPPSFSPNMFSIYMAYHITEVHNSSLRTFPPFEPSLGYQPPFLLMRQTSWSLQSTNTSVAARPYGTPPFKPSNKLQNRINSSLTVDADLPRTISLAKRSGYLHVTYH